MNPDSQPHPAEFWHLNEDERIQCDLCPRYCKLREGQRGLCFVRQRIDDRMVLSTYGRSSGFVIDPIEKKPLNHFYPGSSVLSFGTAGCNLACKFCQNWDISKSTEDDKLMVHASAQQIAQAAFDHGCQSVAFTYNDPVIFHEYARDVAEACHQLGIKTVAVTAGYISDLARAEFFQYIDATNVDLKAFSQEFYYKTCGGDLNPVLKTLEYLRHETGIWLEITTLLIPGHNDSYQEIAHMCNWIVAHLGENIPHHFTAFHPDWRMMDPEPTPWRTLNKAHDIARKAGMRHVYTGNVVDPERSSSYCSHCHKRVITRNGHKISDWKLSYDGYCLYCNTLFDGVIEGPPGISLGSPYRVSI